MSSTGYKGPKSRENRNNIDTRIKRHNLFIRSFYKETLNLYVKYSTTYSFSPNIKVIFSGYDHRSWINIFISYQDILKDNSLCDNKYFHQIIQLSNDSEVNYITNTLANGGDQVLVLLPDKVRSCVWKTLDLTITGKSSQVRKVIEFLPKGFIWITVKMNLWWNVHIHRLPASPYLVSLKGDSHQFEANFVPKCDADKLLLRLNVYSIPGQLSTYRHDALNKPHSCAQEHFELLKLKQKFSYHCLNFSSDSTTPIYYVYITNMDILLRIMNYGQQSYKMSWDEASSVCQYMGGFLPVIRSKSELDGFIALLALSPYLPLQKRILIALSSTIKHKVLFCTPRVS